MTKTPGRDPLECLWKGETFVQVETTYEDSQLECLNVLPPQDVEQHAGARILESERSFCGTMSKI